MNILEAIIAEKRIEVEQRKKQVPLENLRHSALMIDNDFHWWNFCKAMHIPG